MPNDEPRCKRPSKDVSKAAREAQHKAKMMGKFFRNKDPSFHKRGTVHNHKGVL